MRIIFMTNVCMAQYKTKNATIYIRSYMASTKSANNVNRVTLQYGTVRNIPLWHRMITQLTS